MKNSKKGVSPLIATVLLVALVVFVAGMLSGWIPDFIRSITGGVNGKKIECSNAGIGVSNLRYCNGWLSGAIRNTNMIDVNNITMQVVFQNATPVQTIYLTQSGTAASSAESTLSLKPNEVASFNVSISGSNYYLIDVYTPHCPGVHDEAEAADVTRTC